jgi:hypothetical protein
LLELLERRKTGLEARRGFDLHSCQYLVTSAELNRAGVLEPRNLGFNELRNLALGDLPRSDGSRAAPEHLFVAVTYNHLEQRFAVRGTRGERSGEAGEIHDHPSIRETSEGNVDEPIAK